MSYPIGKNQKICPFCYEYGIDKEIEFIKRKDLIFLINSIETLITPFYYDNHNKKFCDLKEQYKIKSE